MKYCGTCGQQIKTEFVRMPDSKLVYHVLCAPYLGEFEELPVTEEVIVEKREKRNMFLDLNARLSLINDPPTVLVRKALSS